MVANQEHGSANEEQRPQAAQRKAMSWAAMLAWIFSAFLLAALVAYRLVLPFFHRG